MTNKVIYWGLGIGAFLLFWRTMKRNAFGNPDTVFPPDVERWRDLASKYGDKNNVPVQLILAVIQKESGGNPEAIGDSGEARGLMQLHPEADFQVDHSIDNLLDPEENIRNGAEYLSWCYNRTGTWLRALQAYNGGIGNVWRGTVSEQAKEYANIVHSFAEGELQA